MLEIKDLHGVDYRGVEILKGLSLNVRRGEILGIAGIDGNGQTELAEIITGLRKATKGEVLVGGYDVCNKPPRVGFEHGVSSIPADRQKHGLVLEFSVAENMILQNYAEPEFSHHGILNKENILKYASDAVKKYDIRPRGCALRPAGTLSGGNQQKVVIARSLNTNPRIIILDEPTKGIDVGSKNDIYNIINDMAAEGAAVIMISSELPELMGMSDRYVVMAEGRVVGELSREEGTDARIMEMAVSTFK